VLGVSRDQSAVVDECSRGDPEVRVWEPGSFALEIASDPAVALAGVAIERQHDGIAEELHRAIEELWPVDADGSIGELTDRHGCGALLGWGDLRESLDECDQGLGAHQFAQDIRVEDDHGDPSFGAGRER
jgi:hypothetical protein